MQGGVHSNSTAHETAKLCASLSGRKELARSKDAAAQLHYSFQKADAVGFLIQVFNLVPTRTPLTARSYATQVMPIGLRMALSLLFGNLSYLYLSMSFIQILKVSRCLALLVAAHPGWPLVEHLHIDMHVAPGVNTAGL